MPDAMDEKLATRIRNRASYRMFQELFDFLKAEPSVTEVLKKFYEVLNTRYSFGSWQKAIYAWESFELVVKDNGEGMEGEKEVVVQVDG